MADIQLLPSRRSQKSSPRASQDSDFSAASSIEEDASSSAEDDFSGTYLNQKKFGTKSGWHSKSTFKICGSLNSRRRAVMAVASISVLLIICLGLTQVASPSPPRPREEKFQSKLPKLNMHHRHMPCTTWSNEAVQQAASQWKMPKLSNSTDFNAGCASREWKKPNDVKVVAMVFYGRREYVDILDCYLRQNLVSQGGYLDEVQFVANAADPKDYKYLDKLVETTDEYKRLEVPERCDSSVSWAACLWDVVADRDTMYIKIDDDVLYIHPDTIPSLVETRIQHKEPLAIGANLVNVVVTGAVHYHNGAIRPYLPEPNVTTVQDSRITWRSSELPSYPLEDGGSLDRKRSGYHMRAPFSGHRWLPLKSSWTDLKKTPMSKIEGANHPDPGIVRTWAANAQQQYSLLENLETKQLGKYLMGGDDELWYPHFLRYNINFLAVWGSDIADNLPFDDAPGSARDEKVLAVTLPQKLRRPFVVQSRALALHYAFHRQVVVRETDLLDRWRAYANENVCHKMKRPFGRQCKGVEDN